MHFFGAHYSNKKKIKGITGAGAPNHQSCLTEEMCKYTNELFGTQCKNTIESSFLSTRNHDIFRYIYNVRCIHMINSFTINFEFNIGKNIKNLSSMFFKRDFTSIILFTKNLFIRIENIFFCFNLLFR